MKFLLNILLLCLLLFSCGDNSQLKPVNYGMLFHDGNSKIWMLHKVMIGDKDYSPRELNEKDILIFYENSKCVFQPLKSLGDYVGKKGEYTLYHEDKLLTIYFQGEKWEFKLNSIQENKIILSPTKNSEINYKIEIIPLPEL